MGFTFLGNDATAWLHAFAVTTAVLLGLYLVKMVVVRRLSKLAERTATRLDDLAVAMAAGTRLLAMGIVAVYAGAMVLDLPSGSKLFITRAAVFATLVQVALWGDIGVREWLAQYHEERDKDPARATSTAALAFIARVVLWAVIILMILDNLGFNITTLVASLGIGGIAVALAVQKILGDLFSSLSIVLDKPFVVGDFITVDDRAGTVEYVGLKTTRVRSLNGEQIIFSNTDLLDSRIHNLKRMETRRVAFILGVVYGTPEEQLRAIPPLVEGIVREHGGVTFDRAHFKRFGASSLDFEVVYIVNSPDYLVFMDAQQEINFRIYRAFTERGIEFAFPTQTLHLAGELPGHGERAVSDGSPPK